jgi:hypothetical protein
MAPFNALGTPTKASQFALKIVEFPIIRDYLSETHGVPKFLVAQVPNEEDWWDTVDKDSYAKVMSKRHKRNMKYESLMADNIRWPDISTFKGPTLLRYAYGDAIKESRFQRTELYEIKPNNDNGRRAALQKLDDVESSYKRYGISGIYRRGKIYPSVAKKLIPLETPYLQLFRYIVTLGLKAIGAAVESIYFEVTRPYPGVLLYKICVYLDGVDGRKKEEVWRIAAFAVRMLLVSQTAYETADIQKATELFADSLAPSDPKINPKRVERIVAGKDLCAIPYLDFKNVNTVPELKSDLEGIRATMYSRLSGEPGDRYFICSDETWYQARIGDPGRQKVAAQLKLLRHDTLFSGKGSSFVNISAPLVLTVDEAIERIPVIRVIYRSIKRNIGTVLIIIGCTILVTAAVLVILGTGGTAAPAMAPTVMATASSAEIAALSAPPAAAAASTAGAGGVATGGAIRAVSAVRGSTQLVQWARTAIKAGSTAEELSAARGAALADKILVESLKQMAQSKVVAAGFGLFLVGLSSRTAHAYSGPQQGPIAHTAIGDVIHKEIGSLFVLRVPKILPYPVAKTPELYKEFNPNQYKEFDAKSFTNPQLDSANNTLPPKMFMLGSFEIA